MGPARYLLDTNCPIDLFHGRFSASAKRWLVELVQGQTYGISVISQIEILGFDATDEEDQVMKEFTGRAFIFPLGPEVINRTIEIKKQLKIKLPDAIIAATALVYDLTLVPRNTKDFEKVSGLKVINAHDQ